MIERCVYNVALLLYLLFSLPKIGWERVRGKRHPSLMQRLGFFLPSPRGPTIWLHAVSVGEVKAASPFFLALKETFPGHWFCLTTTTQTGYEEARRSLPGLDATLFSPIDFSFVSRRFVKKIAPQLFFLVETDFWPQLLAALQKEGTQSFLISGKYSARAASRWKWFPHVARTLFSRFDLLCMQTEEYADRISPFVADRNKVCVTGNLKFDLKSKEVRELSLPGTWISLSCTHAPEESLLLDLLKGEPWHLFLAPRHPERFEEVALLLTNKKIPFIRWKDLSLFKGEKVVLVDSMGELASCYRRSSLAIMGGSFVPGIGGHNLLEPSLYGCPPLFGPYFFGQKQMAQNILKAKAGRQASLDNLILVIHEMLDDQRELKDRSLQLVSDLSGVVKTTIAALSHVFGARKKGILEVFLG